MRGANRRDVMRGLSAGLLAGAGAAAFPRRSRAAAPIQMISHRYPALEYYAERMRTAIPGVEVNTQLMPFDKALELATIALSAKADTLDIVYQSESTFLKFVKNGWLRPLDDLWDKYREEFNLDDFPESSLRALSHDGHIYVVPHVMNTMLFFYRSDLLEEAGKEPPKTHEEYLALAEAFHSPMRAGTISCLKPVDAGLNEAHWYMNTIGGGWFDDEWRPIFNSKAGVAAIKTMKEITQYAQRGFATAANDECAIALQQDLAAMGLQWVSRAGAMDDPTKSIVVDKIKWAVPPGGKQRISASGYAISAFSKQDPDTLFRILATSSSVESMRGTAEFGLPVRRSLLNDEDLQARYRHFKAALPALEAGLPFPPIAEFYELGEFITRRILQAVTGERVVARARHLAAAETEDLLKSRGYYQ
jgi:ABC-type glycerol-3-phosphate transport system substrate-binding protein